MLLIFLFLVDRMLVLCFLGFILWLGARLLGLSGITFIKALIAASSFYVPFKIANLMRVLVRRGRTLGIIVVVASLGGTALFLRFYLPINWIQSLIILGVLGTVVFVLDLIAKRAQEEKEYQERLKIEHQLESRSPSSGSASSPITVSSRPYDPFDPFNRRHHI